MINYQSLKTGLLCFALLFCWQFTVQAQEKNSANDEVKIIKLTVGGSLQGKVLSDSWEPLVRIELLSGEPIVLKRSSIAGIFPINKEYHFYDKGNFTSTNGRYFNFVISFFPGFEDAPWSEKKLIVPALSPLKFSAGWRFKQKWDLGAGISFDAYQDYAFIPLFAEARYYLNKNKLAPFIGGKIGYSPLLNLNGWFPKNQNGGLLLNPSLGFKVATKRKSDFFLETGIKMQKTKYVGENLIENRTFLRYSFGLGWIF